MADRDEEQKLDELLDSMLREYSAVEPRPGLETRILANLREVQAKRRSWSILSAWAWGGAAVTAVLIAALMFHLVRPAVQPPATRVEEATTSPVPPAPVNAAGSNETERSHARLTHRVRPPDIRTVADNRPDVFPTPAPLSEQEQLLLRYLAGTPKEELIAQSRPDEPPEESIPDDQSALPVPGYANRQLSNSQ
jgi:hypothetical protein